MKKAVSLLLIAAWLLSLTACGEKPSAQTEAPVPEPEPFTEPEAVSEPEPEPAPPEPVRYTREQMQEAIVQTALAYYYHNPYVQYDGMRMVGTMEGSRTLNTNCTPESASNDEWLYTFCSDYSADVYREATGWSVSDNIMDFLTYVVIDWTEEPLVVFRYDSASDPRSKEDALAECHALLQPGDIIDYVVASGAGHMLIYLGEINGDGKEYILHSTSTGGGTIKWDSDTPGANPMEPSGSIHLQTTDDILFAKGKERYLPNAVKYMILRPINLLLEEDGLGTLTPSGESRLRYPRMEFWKQLDCEQYHDVLPGETVTVKLTVRNRGAQPYTALQLTEPLPEGQTFLSASEGGVLRDGNVCWTIDIPARRTVELTYQIKTVGAPGDTIRFAPGTVGLLPTRDVSVQLAACRLTEAQTQKLAGLTVSALPEALKSGEFRDLDSVNILYKELFGIDPQLPATFAELLDAVTDTTTVEGEPGAYRILKGSFSPEAQQTMQMLIRKHYFGRFGLTQLGESHLRVIEFLEERYQPGDVFAGTFGTVSEKYEPENLVIQIFLGGGKVLVLTPGSTLIRTFEQTTARNLSWDFGFAFRPTLLRKP